MPTDWLGDLLGIREVVDGSAGNLVLPMRRRIRFIGGAIIADDPGNDATTIEIPLGGEGGELPDIATDRLLGRDTAGTGDPEQIIVTNGLGFTGSGGIGIVAGGVTDTRLRDSAGLSVIGRGANTTGAPADLVASGDGQVLRRNGSTLAFGTVGTLGIADAAITNAKLANMTGPAFKGRQTGTGAPEDMTATQATALLNVFTSSLKGLVPASGGGTVLYLRADGTWDAPPGSGGVVDNGVTFPKIQDIPTDTLIGRDTAGTGDPESIAVGGNLEFTGAGAIRRGALTNDVTAPAGSGVTTIAANAVTTAKIIDAAITDAKLRNSAAVSVLGRAAGTAGVPADIVATGNGQVLRMAGGVLAFGTIDGTSITNGTVTVANLADLAGLSVLGRASNTTGVMAAITAANDGEVLRRNGVAVGFGTVGTLGLTNNAVTFGKFQTITTDRLLGRDTAGTGAVEEIGVGGGLEFDGAGNIRRGALTSDVTSPAGSSVTTIAPAAVTDAKLRNSAACSVIGRSANVAGTPADIAATVNDRVFGRTGDALGFFQVTGAMVADGTLPIGKLANITAASRVIGRGSALGAGPAEELVPTGGIEVSGLNLQLAARTGDVTSPAGSTSNTISNNAVSDAKLRDSAACSVMGRSVNSVGDPADIASTADGEVFRRLGAVIGWGTISTAGIANNAVTYAKLQATAAAARVLGRNSTSAGTVEELVPSGGIEVSGTALQRSAFAGGDVTAAAGSAVLTIVANAVTNADLRDSVACSVIGRSVNSTGDPADIASTVDGQVLMRTAGVLGWGTIVTASITDAAVTYAKIQNVSAASRVLGRGSAAGAGPAQELTPTGGLEVATTNLQIATAGVTSAMLRNSAALSVIGRSANTAGVPADIASATDGHVLRQSGAAIGFGTIATGGIADAAVTSAKLRNSSALSLMGRPTNTAGVPSDIVSVSDNTVLLRQSSALAFGKVPLAAVENVAQATLVGRAVGAGTGAPTALTAAQYRALHREAFPIAHYNMLAGPWLSDQRIPLFANTVDTIYTLGGVPTNYVTIGATGLFEFHVQAVISFPGVSSAFAHWYISVYLGAVLQERMYGFHEQYSELADGMDQGVTVSAHGVLSIPSAPSANVYVSLHHDLGPGVNYQLDYSTGLFIRQIG